MTDRPQTLKGATRSVRTARGRVYVTVNYKEGKPWEVFCTLGKCGSEERAYTEALGRLMSVSLQRGVSLGVLTKQTRGISSQETMGLGPNKILSVPDAIGRALEEFLTEEDEDG